MGWDYGDMLVNHQRKSHGTLFGKTIINVEIGARYRLYTLKDGSQFCQNHGEAGVFYPVGASYAKSNASRSKADNLKKKYTAQDLIFMKAEEVLRVRPQQMRTRYDDIIDHFDRAWKAKADEARNSALRAQAEAELAVIVPQIASEAKRLVSDSKVKQHLYDFEVMGRFMDSKYGVSQFERELNDILA